MRSATAANFVRSAKEPRSSDAVMPAKVAWKQTKISSGMAMPTENVAPGASGATPERNAFENPPMKSEPPVKASEYPKRKKST
jgi:hypothetical protein